MPRLAAEPAQGTILFIARLKRRAASLDGSAAFARDSMKHIPVGRGLGGGSSDAAAALVGMMRLAQEENPAGAADRDWLQPGRRCAIFPVRRPRAWGSDAAMRFIRCRTGRATQCWSSPRAALPCARRTPTGGWQPRLTKRTARPLQYGRFCALCWSAQEAGLCNDFEAAVFPRHPRLGKIKRELLQRGAAEASLAGSGSAVFALFRSPAMARRAAQGFPQDQVFICDTVSQGRVPPRPTWPRRCLNSA